MFSPRAWWLVAVCGACGFDHGRVADTTDSGTGNGSQLDGGLDDGQAIVADAATCYGTFVSICLTATPPAELTVAAPSTINTDTGCAQVVSQTDGPALCVIAARTIRINAHVHASGSRPLVLVATETLAIGAGGLLDVGSQRDVSAMPVREIIGAGSESGALCGSPTAGGADSSGSSPGGGGGAGGSFGGRGGNGARGRNSTGGTAGVAASPAATPTFVRGGCRGTDGGSGAGNAGGLGAAGGGAVLAIAGISISNAGHVRASGMGGYGGAAMSGGGGGGSGGFIGLDAPAVTNGGILNANGGGGGEGGGSADAGGTASSAAAGTGPAPGGAINQNGGDGGTGSWATISVGGAGVTDSNGGGAGAGGAGVIRVFPMQTLGGTVSPPAS